MCHSSAAMLAVLVGCVGCAAPNFNQPKPYSQAVEPTAHTTYGGLAAGWAAIHGEKSGFFPLWRGMDALGARLDMAGKAEKSLDLQYFLFNDDTAGLLLSYAILDAADRGVRARILLDDVFSTVRDADLLALAQHPNIEVRLFNPISRRGVWALNFVRGFDEANRRMHNKSFIVDNAICVVGGRNIAEEYFELRPDKVFTDFDVVAFGAVVPRVSDSFDEYWNHHRAIPVEQLLPRRKTEPLERMRAQLMRKVQETQESTWRRALESKLLQDLISGERPLYVADAKIFADKPSKLDEKIGVEHALLVTELDRVLDAATKEAVFITPYYVPGRDGVIYAKRLVDKGLRVVVLTNSQASNNHTAAHSAYARYRRAVLDAGVELFELRATASQQVEGVENPKDLTMHTKLILIDRRFLFIGSLNLDPRSIEVNTEMGILIDSPDLAGAIAVELETEIPKSAYRVCFGENEAIEWHGLIGGENVVTEVEPLTSRWQRVKAWFLRIVPEGLL